jgi:hypothetical protein
LKSLNLPFFWDLKNGWLSANTRLKDINESNNRDDGFNDKDSTFAGFTHHHNEAKSNLEGNYTISIMQDLDDLQQLQLLRELAAVICSNQWNTIALTGIHTYDNCSMKDCLRMVQ